MVVAICLLPAAAAEMRLADLEGPTGPIEPDVEHARMTMTLQLDCEDAMRYPTTPPMVTIEPWSEPGVVVSGATSHALATDECQDPTGQLEKEVEFMVAVTRDVPAFEAQEVRFTATITEPTVGDPIPDATLETTVQAGFWGLIQARSPASLKQVDEGQIAQFELEIQLFANAPARVIVDVETEGPDAAVPAPVDLDPALDPVHTVLIAVDTSGFTGETHYAVTAAGHALQDVDAAIPQVQANFLLRSEGGLATPGPLAVPALAIAAMLARRDKNQST